MSMCFQRSGTGKVFELFHPMQLLLPAFSVVLSIITPESSSSGSPERTVQCSLPPAHVCSPPFSDGSGGAVVLALQSSECYSRQAISSFDIRISLKKIVKFAKTK